MVEVPIDGVLFVIIAIWSAFIFCLGGVIIAMGAETKLSEIYEYMTSDKSDEWVHSDIYDDVKREKRKLERELKSAKNIAELHDNYIESLKTEIKAKDAKIACLDAENCKLKLKN